MVNIYQSMLTTSDLERLLLQLGFLRQSEASHFQAGQIRVQVLDAPRLLVYSPAGIHYIAVLSAHHLAQQVEHLIPRFGIAA